MDMQKLYTVACQKSMSKQFICIQIYICINRKFYNLINYLKADNHFNGE